MGPRREHPTGGAGDAEMRIVNLCFHGIGAPGPEREPGESRYWVAEATFLRILDAVVGRPNVCLSFDDGNRSDLDIALPALRERGLQASFFVLAGRLADSRSLDPAALRELRSAGMRIGSHGWRHVSWRGLSPADRRQEFIDARDAIAEASRGPVDTAALPLGQYDRVALRELRSAGYTTVYTSDGVSTRPSAWLQSRYSVTRSDTVSQALQAARLGVVGEVRQRLASVVKRLR